MHTKLRRPPEPAEQLLIRGVRHSLLAEVAAARRALAGTVPTDRNIHAARKSLKRARADLRLMRPILGDARYGRENAQLRNAARVLARLRDAKVLHSTINDLMRDVANKAQLELLSQHRMALAVERREVERRVRSRGELAHVKRRLQEFSTMQRSAPAKCNDSLLIDGMMRTYRRGRRAFKQAERTHALTDMHEWRKQLKYLAQQLKLLRTLGLGVVSVSTQQADKAADELGASRDLAMLGERFVQLRPWCDNPHMKSLIERVQKKRRKMERKALHRADRIYREAPHKFAQRWHRAWAKTVTVESR